MKKFMIKANEYLNKDIEAYYSVDYLGYNKIGNPNYLNILKNDFNSRSIKELKTAAIQLYETIKPDLNKFNKNLTLCLVPRSKAEKQYHYNQLYFKRVIKYLVKELGFVDGTDYIIRHTNTKTTHLTHSEKKINIYNDGNLPYPGITKDTCFISNEVKNKNILLVDDIYTPGINIDEDAIESLLQKGAKSVTFYAVAKTISNQIF